MTVGCFDHLNLDNCHRTLWHKRYLFVDQAVAMLSDANPDLCQRSMGPMVYNRPVFVECQTRNTSTIKPHALTFELYQPLITYFSFSMCHKCFLIYIYIYIYIYISSTLSLYISYSTDKNLFDNQEFLYLGMISFISFTFPSSFTFDSRVIM